MQGLQQACRPGFWGTAGRGPRGPRGPSADRWNGPQRPRPASVTGHLSPWLLLLLPLLGWRGLGQRTPSSPEPLYFLRKFGLLASPVLNRWSDCSTRHFAAQSPPAFSTS